MKLILVRHAAYAGGEDPPVSDHGKEQAAQLAEMIASHLNGDPVTIWSSSARRATGTAEIIHELFPEAELIVEEKLWSDNWHPHDFDWLFERIEQFEGPVLVVVSHLEYVQDFPGAMLGRGSNGAGYAEGVIIDGDTVHVINQQ